MLFTSAQKKYNFGIGGEALLPLLISLGVWKPMVDRKKSTRPLLVVISLAEVELPLLQFAPSQISP